MQVSIERFRAAEPLAPTLAVMARAANEAARTWTVQEHVGRLAALAGPRDYIGQLRALYDDFTQRRWRYVMEPGERVPGSARALLGHVFGAAYNKGPDCPDPERCAPGKEWSRGWGDCDDAACYMAAGTLALGMRPAWRVVRWPGGAHVSVIATTPRGEKISVDPVGYPEHPFGWAATPPRGVVEVFELVAGSGETMSGVPGVSSAFRTWFHDHTNGTRVARKRPHIVAVAANDDRGARVLAVPQWAHRVFKRGLVVPRARGYDQFGQLYEYVSGQDMWFPVGNPGEPPANDVQLGGRAERLARRKRRQAKRAARREGRQAKRGKRKAKRKERWQNFKKKTKAFFVKVRKGIARVFKKISQSKIATFFRKLKTKFLRNPLVKGAISTVLSAFGVPRKATNAILEREASLAERGGRSKMAVLAAEGKWGELAKMVGGTFVDAAKTVVPGLSGFEGEALGELPATAGCRYQVIQGGRQYHAAPVAAMTGVPGVYLAGQLEISDTPQSGRWYRIQYGDTLFGVVSAAFGVGPGPERLKIAKWINASAVNKCLHTDEIPEKEKGWFGGSRISFMARFSCLQEDQSRCEPGDCYGIMWIAPAAGVDPPELADEPDIDGPPGGDCDDERPCPEGTKCEGGWCVTINDGGDDDDDEEIDPPPGPPDEDDEEDVPEPVDPEDTPEEPEPDPEEPPAPPDDDEPEPVEPEDDEPPIEDPDDDDDDDTPPAPTGVMGNKALWLGLAALVLQGGSR
jgi:hypothetical protein